MNDLALLVSAARAAGDLARPFWRNTPQVWDKGQGAGPVTEADLAVNALLLDQLTSARPDYGWLSEETPDDPRRLDCEHVFIVDPIDGTRAFIAGEKTWAHSLAVARNGQVTAAVVYLPICDKLYSAHIGGPALLNDAPISNSGRDQIDGATVLSAKKNFDPSCWPAGMPGIKRHFRPSLAYRLALVAEGRFDAMITFRDTWEWDVAAGSLIATRAGACVTDRTGTPPKYNNPHPALNGLVASAPVIHDALCPHRTA